MDDRTASIEELEAAADRMMVRAERLRLADSREPEADDSVIAWEHTYAKYGVGPGDTTEDKTYSFVAVKAEGKWYLTGKHTAPLSWRELHTRYPALAEGRVWSVG